MSALVLPSSPVTRLPLLHPHLLTKIPLSSLRVSIVGSIGDASYFPSHACGLPKIYSLFHFKLVSKITSFNGLLFFGRLFLLSVVVVLMSGLALSSMSFASFLRLILLLWWLGVMVTVARRRKGRVFTAGFDTLVLLGVGGVSERVVSVWMPMLVLMGWESDYRGGSNESDNGSGLKTHG
jgi:hypothetical protein